MRAINHSDNSPEEVPFRDCRGDREGVGGKRLSCLNPITVLKDLLCFNQEKKEFKKKRERERELPSDHYARFPGPRNASLDRQNNFFSFNSYVYQQC